MRMLIIAGPYEADRLRREATAAGIESVAIEPSGNLASWLQATDPALIVLVPGILHPDPAVAVGKVRAASTAHVPLLLVGEAAEASALGALAEGFLARPVSELGLRHQIRVITGAEVVEVPAEELPSGPVVAAAIATESSSRPRPLRPLVAEGSGPTEARQAEVDAAPAERAAAQELAPPRGRATLGLFDRMADFIDAAFDEEIVRSARAVAVPPAAEVDDAVAAASSDARAASDEEDEARVFFAGHDASARETMEAPDQRLALRSGETTASSGEDRSARTPPGSGPASLPSLVAGGLLGEGTPPLDLASVLGRLHLARATGRLVLTSRADGPVVERFVVFEGGQPVLAGSSLPAERGEGGESAEAARHRHEELIYAMFAWEPVQYRFGVDDGDVGGDVAGASSRRVRLTTHPAALLLEGLRRKVAPEATLARLGGKDVVFRLRATSEVAALLAEMGLSAEERRLTLFLDGVRSLAAIQEATRVAWSSLAAIVRVLMVLDRLELVSAPRAEGPAPARDAAQDEARVLAAHALVEEADYFRLLGVERSASREEIAAAHRALRRELGAATLEPSVVKQLKDEIESIAEVLDESWRVLGDDERRRRYRAGLERGAYRREERAAAPSREGRS